MNDTLQAKLTLFTDNAQAIRKKFTWQNELTKRLAALLFAQDNRAVDCDAIKQCHTLIKRNTGAFSFFRGNMTMCAAALLALSPDPARLFQETLKVYALLKAERFRSSDFLVVSACQIAARAGEDDYAPVVSRMRAFYDAMKARHFFLTGRDDYIYSAMLALTELDVEVGAARVEQLYNLLKGEFWGKNNVQALAQVLALGASEDSAVQRVLELRDALRAEKIKLDKGYTLSALGILALLPVDTAAIVSDLAEVRAALRAVKGFGPLAVSTQELLLFAVSLTADEYAAELRDGALAALSTGITSIIIAQQAAMIAAISASSSAASSAAAASS